jgi:glycosyltransferase involved in cell wall biosynthesis
MLLGRAWFSGVEQSILRLAEALCRTGREHYTFYVPKGSHAHAPAGPTFRTVRCRIPARVRLFRLLWEQLAQPRQLARDKADVFHGPGYLAPPGLRIPCVLTVYDLIALDFPRLCRPTNRVNYGVFLPLSIQRATRIIVPSETTCRDLLRRYPRAESRMRVIPLGVSENLRRGTNDVAIRELRERYGLDKPFILFLGTMEPKKNLIALLRAFDALKRDGQVAHKLVIAGAPGWHTGPLHGFIRRRGLDREVIITGFVPAADLPALYGAADLLAFPSLYEGFGLPPLEAMTCGTPVVCTNRGAVPEVVGDAAVLVDPTDTSALAGAVLSVLRNEGHAEDLVARGRRRASRFSWDETARRTDDVYREVHHSARENPAK